MLGITTSINFEELNPNTGYSIIVTPKGRKALELEGL
jgi:hypothetical protein